MDLNQLLHHHQMALMVVSQARREGQAMPNFDLPRYYAKRINEYRERRGLSGDAEAIADLAVSPADAVEAPDDMVSDVLIAELLMAKAFERATHQPLAAGSDGTDDQVVDIRDTLLAVGRDFYRSLGLEDSPLAAAIDEAASRLAWEGEDGGPRPQEEGIIRTHTEQFAVGGYRHSHLADAKAAARRQREATSDGRRARSTTGMKRLIAFDLDGTLAESKQPLDEAMGEALADLLGVVDVAIISGGDWPQFDKQIASRLPVRADRSRLWLMPTTGTKLYTFRSDAWQAVYAELFADDEKQRIFDAFDAALEATGFVPEAVWGERIEDRGSQITFSALGQQAPIDAKEQWDPDFAKRKIVQHDLRARLPGLSINMGGATSIDITREGVDKAYGLTKLRDESGIPLDAMMFIGDAIFPGGNDYPAKTLGLDTICVRDPRETLAVIASIVACLK